MRRDSHEKFMAMCFRQAEKGKGHVSPNPLVGAVLVKGGRVVARGYHHRFGGPHAEVECLRSYRGDLRDTTLYVNLEPCSHQGKTPPCADLVVESRIRSVVVAMKDPNPLVCGRGIRKLRNAGVKVMTGVLEGQAEELNRKFITYITKRRPFIHVKLAQSLDGRIALDPASPTQITGAESRRLVHQWRAEHDMVLVGAGTVLADDPLLTVRLAKGRNPSVAVIDGSFSLGPGRRIWRTAKRREIILLVQERSAQRQKGKVRQFTSLGVRIVPIAHPTVWLPMRKIMNELYRMNIGSVLVEGGSCVFSQFWNEGLFDIFSVFVSPVVFESGVPAFAERIDPGLPPRRPAGIRVSARPIGQDVLLQYRSI